MVVQREEEERVLVGAMVAIAEAVEEEEETRCVLMWV